MYFKTKTFFLLLTVLLLQGCGSNPSIWGEDQIPIDNNFPLSFFVETSTPTSLPTATLTPSPTFTFTPTLTPTITLIPTDMPPSMRIKRVIILSFDGLRADAVDMVPMENLQAIMRDGAYSLHARTINYAVTLPAHASMLSGTCQSKHGVWWNSTMYYKGYSKGTDIFDLAHEAGLKTVMIVNKEKMRQLAEPETTDVYKLVYGIESTIMQTAIDQFEDGFDLMFVHFGSPDDRGHKYGWLSGTQFNAFRALDAALAQLLDAMDQYGIRDSTLLIVTADHGGHGKEHVGTVIQDLEIPWVAYGPGVRPQILPNPISIMDTAPTVAYALELPIQPDWDGRLVYDAFGLPVEHIHPPNYRICK